MFDDADDDRKKKKRHELLRLRVREISAVDKPATGRRFLVIKRADPSSRSEPVSEPDYRNVSIRKAAVVELEHAIAKSTAGVPPDLRQRADALVAKFADAYQRLDPSLTRAAAEVRAYEQHPELLEMDFACADLGQATPMPAVPPAPVETESDRVWNTIEAHAAAICKAASISKAAAVAIVFEREPDLIARYNNAQAQEAAR